MSVHMIMPPTLKGSPWVVRVLAIDLNHLVEHPTCVSKTLIAKMVSEHQKHLKLVSVGSFAEQLPI